MVPPSLVTRNRLPTFSLDKFVSRTMIRMHGGWCLATASVVRDHIYVLKDQIKIFVVTRRESGESDDVIRIFHNNIKYSLVSCTMRF